MSRIQAGTARPTTMITYGGANWLHAIVELTTSQSGSQTT